MLVQPIDIHPWDVEDLEYLKKSTDKPAVRVRLAADGELEAMSRHRGIETVIFGILHEFALSPQGPDMGSIMAISTIVRDTVLKMMVLSGDKPGSYYVVDFLHAGVFAVIETDYNGVLQRLIPPENESLTAVRAPVPARDTVTVESRDESCRVCQKKFVTGDIVREALCAAHKSHPVHHRDCAARAREKGIQLGSFGVFKNLDEMSDPVHAQNYENARKEAEALCDLHEEDE